MGNVHGGGYGQNTKVSGNVELTLGTTSQNTPGVTVYGDVYGGSALGTVNTNAQNQTNVTLNAGTVNGSIYGGGLGDQSTAADVNGAVAVTVNGGSVTGGVFGGNNISGRINGSITINIEQTGCLPLEIGELYLGGNNAPYSVYGYNNDGTIKTEGTRIYDQPVMNLKSFKSIGTVFGGGQGESAVLAGDPTINVNVATGWVDGQYKGIGDQDPKSSYHAKPQDLTPDGVIGTIYGGGNAADVIGNTNINIGNQATVEMHSLAVIKQKIQESANGQFTTGGMIFKLSDDEKSITYTVVGQTEPAMTKQIIQTVNGANITGNVYGGGNAAAVTGSTNVVLGKE